jgi:hypothetical protein
VIKDSMKRKRKGESRENQQKVSPGYNLLAWRAGSGLGNGLEGCPDLSNHILCF